MTPTGMPTSTVGTWLRAVLGESAQSTASAAAHDAPIQRRRTRWEAANPSGFIGCLVLSVFDTAAPSPNSLEALRWISARAGFSDARKCPIASFFQRYHDCHGLCDPHDVDSTLPLVPRDPL